MCVDAITHYECGHCQYHYVGACQCPIWRRAYLCRADGGCKSCRSGDRIDDDGYVIVNHPDEGDDAAQAIATAKALNYVKPIDDQAAPGMLKSTFDYVSGGLQKIFQGAPAK